MSTAPSPGRIQSLFSHALDLEGSERAVWLAALRDEDPLTAARVERLLELDAQQVDPFSHAVNSVREALDIVPSEWIGREIGGFRLLEVLGQGGMSTVFLAERQMRDFEHQVALKLLRGYWIETGSVDRFADERRILARLHHPNIATLIDAGATGDGRPFLVMEYIDGTSLHRYCDQRCMPLRERVVLMRSLLDALAYAHRCLVVHRDLKPGNVLVTEDGTLKLLDFGIARLLESEAATLARSTRVFTPEYASPEQLDGRTVGTGSDLYSFGLILYELCTGVLPWNKDGRSLSDPTPPMTPSQRLRGLNAAQAKVLAKRRASDPQHLVRSLKADLERILMRCLEADPARRYTSAHELDTDLMAWLAMRPPPGVQVPRHERMLAFARRHAWPLVAATLLLSAGAALLVQALVGQHQLSIQRDRAVAAAVQARVEAAKSSQVAGFVQSMLAGIDPDRARGMDRSLMRLVLDAAATRASEGLGEQPAVRSAIEHTIGTSYDRIGDYALAVQHLELALNAAAAADNTPEVLLSLGVDKARSMANLGDFDQARTTLRTALEQTQSLPETSRARLSAGAAIANLDCGAGNLEACRDGYIKVLEKQRATFGADDIDTEASMLGLAYADTNLAHFESAQALYKSVVAGYRERFGDSDSHTLGAVNGLAVSYLQSRHYADAEALLRPAVERAEHQFGPDHPLTLGMSSNLGGAIRQQPGRNAEARPYYERALDAAQRLSGEDSKRTVYAQINLAVLLRDAGDMPGAERYARTALAHSARALGQDSPYRAMVMDKLASILVLARKYPEARRMLDDAWGIFQANTSFGPDHPEVQTVIKHYVALFTAMGKPELAAGWRERITPVASQPGCQSGDSAAPRRATGGEGVPPCPASAGDADAND